MNKATYAMSFPALTGCGVECGMVRVHPRVANITERSGSKTMHRNEKQYEVAAKEPRP
jgi:hypothetical protein